MIGKNQCEHGSLARKCLVCELTEEVKRLREAIRERDNLVDKMNTATEEFILTYYALPDYLDYRQESDGE